MEYTEKETREHRKAWVEALRSDDYEQAQSVLRYIDNQYCCLGVACDISGLGEWVLYEGQYSYVTDRDSEIELLPIEVQDWLGLKSSTGRHFSDTFQEGKSLSDLNDNYNLTFDDIADIIEAEALDLKTKE